MTAPNQPISVVTFPNLSFLGLDGESETTEAMAMPVLKELIILSCKLACLPPGLASSRRHALREVRLYKLSNLTYIENFPSVVQLKVFDCPKLKRISDLSRLQKIEILYCPNVEVLGGVPSLDSIEMTDGTMETIPEYLTTVTPRYFKFTTTKSIFRGG
jgi:hypothetical protein